MTANERDEQSLQTGAAYRHTASQPRSSSDGQQLDYEMLRKNSDAIGCFALCAQAKCRRARRCMADAFSRGNCKRRCMPREYW